MLQERPVNKNGFATLALIFLIIIVLGAVYVYFLDGTPFRRNQASHVTTSTKENETIVYSDNLEIKGSPSLYLVLKPVVEEMDNGSVQIFNPICVDIKPGCEAALKKSEARDYFSNDYEPYTESEIQCLNEGCNRYDYESPIPLEEVTVTLTDTQLSTILNVYKDQSLPVDSINLFFQASGIDVQLNSTYPLLTGGVKARLNLANYWFYVQSIELGSISIDEKMVRDIDIFVRDKVEQHLSQLYITESSILSIDGNVMTVSLKAPRGFIRQDGAKVVIDNTIYQTLAESYKVYKETTQ